MLSNVARSVRRDRLTYLSPAKLLRIERALDTTLRPDVPGDIVEFGVALGGSAILLAKRAIPPRRFFGLDVFAMIPPPTSDKDDSRSKQRYQDILEGSSSGIGGDVYYGYRDDLYEYVSRQLSRYGTPVDGVRVNLVKGLFEESWPTLEISSLAFAHIDCDWYDPVKYCLNAAAPRLSRGGLIVMDDYHDYAGCKAAVDEFLIANPGFEMLDGVNPVLRHRRS
ncbi:asparagine synthase [Sphingomonas cavernae]|uniref:Asparagine synthase n=2 Tax=Sphingomonas cavernae TaxID=2320861 RepID=A0A418WN98_9SPHN|nr:asparagine synthase [Sphingomonas cavernae]